MARRSVSMSNFIMMPVLVAVAMMSKPLIVLLLTEKWLACVPFLTIFCILRLPGNIIAVDNQVYYALGKSGINLFYEIGLFVLNVSVLLITVQISIMAIAIGALIVEFIGLCAICVISKKVYGYSFSNRISDLWKSTLASIVMALGIYCVSFLSVKILPMLILQCLVAVLLYLLTCRLTNDDNLLYSIKLVKDLIHRK